MTVISPRCPRCASPLPVGVSDAGLCPVCLIGATLQLGADEDEDEDDPNAEPPYQAITLLARGRSGPVYLATPLGTRRRVALTIAGPRADTRDVTRRFARWRGHVAFERYPGVARLLDVGPAPGQCVYLAADYAPGASLGALLCARRLGPAARQTIGTQLIDSVGAMRRKGVAHMRITPARVRISVGDTPRATLIGFGAALVLDGAEPNPDADDRALADILRLLEVTV